MRHFAQRALAVFVLLFLSATLVQADEPLRAEAIVSDNEITITDGRVVRLRGIMAQRDAKAFLESEVLGRAIKLENEFPDRYGRTNASMTLEGKTESIETELLRQGLAFVYPGANDKGLDTLIEAEHSARREGKGFWKEPRDVAPEDAARLAGRFGFIEGVAGSATRIKNKVYLAFGDEGRPSFVVVIAARHLRALRKQGLDPFLLTGKSVRVRGWISIADVPALILVHPAQIERME